MPLLATSEPYAGASVATGTYIIDLAADVTQGLLAIGLSDGTVLRQLLDQPEREAAPKLAAHEGGLTVLERAAFDGGFIALGEDGRVQRIQASGEPETLARFEKEWLEHFAQHASGLLVVGFRKSVAVIDSKGNVKRFAEHPSSVAALALDGKGKRLAVAHYNGVSLWWVNSEATQAPVRLNWKGSHVAASWSGNGKFLLTAMQENALHGWKMPEAQDFQMGGYAAKPRSLSWNAAGDWVATSGSIGVVGWDCSGKGPMGRSATLLGPESDDPRDLTVKVACHPKLDMVAVGTACGQLYLVRRQDTQLVFLRTQEESPITALRWAEDGQYLLAGNEAGRAYVFPFASEAG